MINIKCTYANGNSFTTSVNASFEAAKEYFLGNVFNIGVVNDNMQLCVDIEEI